METLTNKTTPASVAEVAHPKGFLRTFSALQHRNFRLFWTGQMVSLIGTWMQATGQAWLVLQLTHSAWWLGLVGALQFLPVMLFTLFGGIVADRLPKEDYCFSHSHLPLSRLLYSGSLFSQVPYNSGIFSYLP